MSVLSPSHVPRLMMAMALTGPLTAAQDQDGGGVGGVGQGAVGNDNRAGSERKRRRVAFEGRPIDGQHDMRRYGDGLPAMAI